MHKSQRFWDCEEVKNLFSKVAEENNIDKSKVKEYVGHMFTQVKKNMIKDELPHILLHNFGSFTTSKIGIDNYIRTLIKAYLDGKVDKEYTKRQLFKLYKKRHEYKKSKVCKNTK